jgi:hypothetical protein
LALKIARWILIALLLTGVTGLLRQKLNEPATPAEILLNYLTPTKNVVDNLRNRAGSVNGNAVLRRVFRLMPSHDAFAFRRLPASPLVVWPLVQPPMQCGKVDFKNKDAVEQIDEFREVS